MISLSGDREIFLMFRFVIKHLGKFSANLLFLWMTVCPRQKEFLPFLPKIYN